MLSHEVVQAWLVLSRLRVLLLNVCLCLSGDRLRRAKIEHLLRFNIGGSSSGGWLDISKDIIDGALGLLLFSRDCYGVLSVHVHLTELIVQILRRGWHCEWIVSQDLLSGDISTAWESHRGGVVIEERKLFLDRLVTRSS